MQIYGLGRFDTFMSLSYRNQSIDLESKSVDWFLYDTDLPQERVKLSNIGSFNVSQIGSQKPQSKKQHLRKFWKYFWKYLSLSF